VRGPSIALRQRIEKEPVHGLSQQIFLRAFEQFLRGGIDQCDMPVQTGRD